ncbi:MAG: hypothetical protein LBV71_04015 [Prevotella sp.]|nr:hypothetical protein [Prevotella sp.]
MKKISTQKLCRNFEEEKVVAPSKNTLDFLKQFARTYYVEKSLPKPLNELCVN